MEASDRELKMTIINRLKAEVGNVDNIHEQMGNFIRYRNSKKVK